MKRSNVLPDLSSARILGSLTGGSITHSRLDCPRDDGVSMTRKRSERSLPAGIQYFGLSGDSNECQKAVLRLLQFGDVVSTARILSCGQEHAVLLSIGAGDLIAIKPGFASGYGGQGPRTFSCVLQALDSHGADIEEYEVSEAFLSRLDDALLTLGDLSDLDEMRPVRPVRWHDYVKQSHEERAGNGTLWRDFPLPIPLAIVDPRLVDLAIHFRNDPDQHLMRGYRRLEGIVRKRIASRLSGQKLFAEAFMGTEPSLAWDVEDPSEQVGMGNLFIAAFMAHRNPRAHRDLEEDQEGQLSEFLLLNHLFRLESQTADTQGLQAHNPDDQPSGSAARAFGRSASTLGRGSSSKCEPEHQVPRHADE